MPRNTNRLRLTTLGAVKDWLRGEIELYTEDEADRREKGELCVEEGNYIDAATFLGVAAKKKIVRQKLNKLLNAIS